MNDIAGLGHNNPPTDEELLQQELLLIEQDLIGKSKSLVDRYALLVDAFKRAPVVCTSDSEASRMGDFARQIGDVASAINDMRAANKKPFDKKAAAVQGFFIGFVDNATSMKRTVLGRVTAWQLIEEERKRIQAAEAARAAREQAEAAARDAAANESAMMHGDAEQNMERAIHHEQEAAQLTKEATAPAADLTRVRGAYGSVTSLRKTWKATSYDRPALDLEALRPYLTDEALTKALNAAVKAGIRSIKGVTIEEVASSTSR